MHLNCSSNGHLLVSKLYFQLKLYFYKQYFSRLYLSIVCNFSHSVTLHTICNFALFCREAIFVANLRTFECVNINFDSNIHI